MASAAATGKTAATTEDQLPLDDPHGPGWEAELARLEAELTARIMAEVDAQYPVWKREPERRGPHSRAEIDAMCANATDRGRLEGKLRERASIKELNAKHREEVRGLRGELGKAETENRDLADNIVARDAVIGGVPHFVMTTLQTAGAIGAWPTGIRADVGSWRLTCMVGDYYLVCQVETTQDDCTQPPPVAKVTVSGPDCGKWARVGPGGFEPNWADSIAAAYGRDAEEAPQHVEVYGGLTVVCDNLECQSMRQLAAAGYPVRLHAPRSDDDSSGPITATQAGTGGAMSTEEVLGLGGLYPKPASAAARPHGSPGTKPFGEPW